MADRQGHPVTEIADAAGISRVRAYQIAGQAANKRRGD